MELQHNSCKKCSGKGIHLYNIKGTNINWTEFCKCDFGKVAEHEDNFYRYFAREEGYYDHLVSEWNKHLNKFLIIRAFDELPFNMLPDDVYDWCCK